MFVNSGGSPGITSTSRKFFQLRHVTHIELVDIDSVYRIRFHLTNGINVTSGDSWATVNDAQAALEAFLEIREVS